MIGLLKGLLIRAREAVNGRRSSAAATPSLVGLPEDLVFRSSVVDASALGPHERVLITNILRLRDITADDVMVPRTDIVALRSDVTLDQAIELIRSDGHSRLPVYREQLDNLVGMVHIKDVYAYSGAPKEFSIEYIARTPLMVAPQIPVLDLLLQMRHSRMHMALVVDEYGGIDGLITIEDLVETITGDIEDEHDDIEAPMLVTRGDGTFDVNARLPIESFEAVIGSILTIQEREAGIETIGGLVLMISGRILSKGEVVSHQSGLEFRILDCDPHRIRRVRVVDLRESSGVRS